MVFKKFFQHLTAKDKPSKTKTQPDKPSPKPPPKKTTSEKAKHIQDYFNKFSKAPKILQPTNKKNIYKKLIALKKIVEQPKEENLEVRAKQIKEHLSETPEGEEVSLATVREERWQPNVQCPNCQSTMINKLDKIKVDKKYQYHYQCLVCGHEFYDDTETPFESGVPPIQIWMQCWYLFGTTRSLEYVSAKLNLDPNLVRQMIEQLQKLFKANHPLTRMKKYKDWLKSARHYEKQINDMLQKTSERQGLEATGQAKDTREYDRLRDRRRGKPTSKPKL